MKNNPAIFPFQLILIFALLGVGPISAYGSCVSAPVVSVSVAPNILWPPNHEYVTVEPTVSVSGSCTPVTIVLLSVTSNEPDNGTGIGDGNTMNDIVIVDDMEIQLRAERSGAGDGRMYTITYEATDASGNSGIGSAVVAVPSSQDLIRY